VASRKNRKKINLTTFLAEYIRGASEEELRERFDLRHSQLTRVVGVLKKRGKITAQEHSKRQDNLKIRFGRSDGLPSSETYRKGEVELDSDLVLHCPSCGAAVKRGVDNCEYCGAHLDFSLRGKTIHCPHCFNTTSADGKFCIHCAKPVKGLVAEGKVLEDRLCPRCEVPMRGMSMGDFSVVQCAECSGLFVPHETFEMMQEVRDAAIFSTQGVARATIEPEEVIKYVRCPVCLKMMNRTNFARISGVIIDSCRDHGIWFDPGEVEKIMAFVAKGGLQKAKAVEMERYKHEEDLRRIRNIQTSGQQANTPLYLGPGDFQPDGVNVITVVREIFGLFRK
jgi:Zn-finger nucleic acid-binding protein